MFSARKPYYGALRPPGVHEHWENPLRFWVTVIQSELAQGPCAALQTTQWTGTSGAPLLFPLLTINVHDADAHDAGDDNQRETRSIVVHQ